MLSLNFTLIASGASGRILSLARICSAVSVKLVVQLAERQIEVARTVTVPRTIPLPAPDFVLGWYCDPSTRSSGEINKAAE